MKDRFPDIWMPSTEQRDLRTLLRDRHQWVKMRTRLQHALQAIALNHVLREGRAQWTAAGRRRLQDFTLARLHRAKTLIPARPSPRRGSQHMTVSTAIKLGSHYIPDTQILVIGTRRRPYLSCHRQIGVYRVGPSVAGQERRCHQR
jgi:hypothetical protein